MPTIEVDVDLNEFETWELLDELRERIERNKPFTDKQKQDIIESINEISAILKINGLVTMPLKTLDDKIKVDHLICVWDKYNSFQLTALLK